MTAPTQLTCDYASLTADLKYSLFGLRSADTPSADQTADIERCIAKGLQFVYSAYRWSFLRPLVSITTHPAYATGTITVDAAGDVTGTDTVFPSYSASALGWLTIPSVGSYAVATYTSGVAIALTDFPAASVFTTASTYTLGFNTYPMPTGVDTLEGQLTFAQGSVYPTKPLEKVSEVQIRRLLAHGNTPGRPHSYAETMNTFDPTAGSSRYISLYPVPDLEYTLTAVGTLRPSMIDSTNKYPLGLEVLAPCITESCLAVAEREIQGMDATHPNAVHNRALAPLLQMAIQRDKEYSSPDTLGVDHGQRPIRGGGTRRVGGGGIYWDAGADYTGYL